MSLFNNVTCVADIYPHFKHLPEVVQLVKHLSEASLTRAKGPYTAELKEDGNYCFVLVADGMQYAFGRSGLRFTNLGFLESKFHGLNDGVYMGEVCNDELELEQFSGVISPNRVNPLEPNLAAIHLQNTEIRLFDYIGINAFINGVATTPYRSRRAQLDAYVRSRFHIIPFTVYDTLEEAEEACKAMIADGHEGGCVKPLHGDWKRGRRDWHSMKVVREISYDLECIGVEDGKGKREGIAANFFFRWKDGKTLKADLGKGWTDARRLEAYLNPPIGKVFRVTAMQASSASGLLRKAKVQEERTDKRADF